MVNRNPSAVKRQGVGLLGDRTADGLELFVLLNRTENGSVEVRDGHCVADVVVRLRG